MVGLEKGTPSPGKIDTNDIVLSLHYMLGTVLDTLYTYSSKS